jgi:hypothetical protein
MRFSFIDAKKAEFPVARLCETLEVSQSGILLGKAGPQVNASARTWCYLPISVSAFACRGRLPISRGGPSIKGVVATSLCQFSEDFPSRNL